MVLFLFPQPVHADTHLSVPLGHRVYDVIAAAELRGLVEPLDSVRPYATSTVLKVLNELLENPRLTNESERREIAYLIAELSGSSVDTGSVLQSGSYRTYSEKTDVMVAVGASIESQSTFSLNNTDQFDMRNAIRPYFRSEIKDFLSISMDVGLRFDRLDNRLFLDNDFTIPGEGFYMDLLNGGDKPEEIPFDQFYAGYDLHPEIAASFLDGMMQFRWGSVNRDWGVGLNNLQLSSTASPFEAIEGQIHFSDWLRYSFITGSLGIFALEEGIDGNEAFFVQTLHSEEFNNNFSAKRLELDFSDNSTFGIYESCIWPKRFELGYLNPFSILMLQQNIQGDQDNMLAGVDFQWRLPGTLRLYGAWATTEMHEISLDELFTHPRNIMAFQGGVDVDLPVGLFSLLTFQYTKLDPFFYTHYPITDDEDTIQTAYVNKGFSLGYPLHPNSDEFLLSARFGVTPRLNTFVTVKYQRRSGQYGFDITESVRENYHDIDLYDPKDFLGNLFEKTLSIEVGLSKSLEQFPLTVYASYRFGSTIYREVDTAGGTEEGSNPNYTYQEAWLGPEYSHAVQIGLMIYR